MAFIPEDGKGRLFDRKADKTKDTQADFSGTAMFEGKHMRISAWHYPASPTQRVGAMSLSIESEAEYQLAAASRRAAKDQDKPVGDSDRSNPPPPPPGDDDIPF